MRIKFKIPRLSPVTGEVDLKYTHSIQLSNNYWKCTLKNNNKNNYKCSNDQVIILWYSVKFNQLWHDRIQSLPAYTEFNVSS